MAKIIGPGSMNIDITGFAPHLPVAGETVKGKSVRFSPGGKGNNQMTAAHRAGADAVKAGAHAGNILKEISVICGGKGGGRPDSAMSGGRDLDKIDEALARVEEILSAI